MPGIAALACTRVLEGLELEPGRGNTNVAAVREQQLLIRRHEVGHRAAFPHVPVHPQAAIHGVDHPIPAEEELAVFRGLGTTYWHAGTPSC